MMAALAVAAGVVRVRRRHRHRRPSRPGVGHLVDQASLLELAVRGGMTLHAALRWCRAQLHPALGDEIEAVLRAATITGLSEALHTASGPSADLFRALARAVETGAALEATIAAVRERLEADAAADLAARMQRLPVKLVVPLALLMLPGLVLMLAVPALIDALSRFG